MSWSMRKTVTPCSSGRARSRLAQLEALVGVEPGRGLVEQDQPGLAGQRPADADQLALAERDLRRVAVDDIFQAADRDGPVDAGPVRRAVRQEQVPQRRGDGHVLAGHQQVLVDGEVVEQLDRLERAGQAEARPPVGAQAADVRPSKVIRPAAGLVYPVRASTIEVLPAPLGPISP
jgi:hypothetical protein